MTFDEMLNAATTLLRQEGRVSYRALRRRFDLTDDDIEDLKAELIAAKRLARDEDGKVLVWAADDVAPLPPVASAVRVAAPAPTPASYTPAHLAERIRAAQAALDAREGGDGERKTITALFADLKGSTALIEHLDPEDARAIIDPALRIMMDSVHAYEGYVAQALGDGIFALFGAPIALEDHAERAVRAALAMQAAMRSYSDQLRRAGGAPLELRVGINSGEVVVRSIRKDDLHTDYVPVGHSTNLAARIEQIARPGTVLISAHTQHLVDGFFKLNALGPTIIRGLDEPLELYEVAALGKLRTRLQVAVTRGLTRFVGRRNEIGQLQQALLQVEDGHGQVVGIMGEPGLGKSRLLHEFKSLIPGHWRVLETNAQSFGADTPYLPVIELLKRYFALPVVDDEQTRRLKVAERVHALDPALEDVLPFLFALLDIEESGATLQHMQPQIRHSRTLTALRRLFTRVSAEKPLIVIVEDLHWIDRETQTVLDAFVDGLATARMLLLTNYRPEYRHNWGNRTYYNQIRLAPLLQNEGGQLLDDLLGSDPELDRLKQQILKRTEGTPFYIEEVVQALVEQGALVGTRGDYRVGAHAANLQIPSTVQGVLAARIDRLPRDEKALLLQLAVIGREFPLALVRKVVQSAEDELERALAALQNGEFLYPLPASATVGFLFKHALTQEVAYGAVLQEQRKALHEIVALATEALYQSNLEDHYPTLAHHYSRSGNLAKAVEYLLRAGAQAVRRHANREATQYFESALELSARLEDTMDRDRHELEICLALASCFLALDGLASARAEGVCLRASEIARKTGRTEHLFAASLGLHMVSMQQARLDTSRDLSQQLLETARQLDDSGLELQAHAAAGVSALFCGELAAAREHSERATAIYEANCDAASGVQTMDHGVIALGFGAKALCLLGELDAATIRSAAAVALARQIRHPSSIAFALYADMVVHESRREWSNVLERAAEEIGLASEHGLPLWHAWGTFFRGRAAAACGDREAGIAQIEAAFDEFETIGSQVLRPYCSALLVEIRSDPASTQRDDALLDDALRRVEATGEHYYEPELYRLKGEVALLGTEWSGRGAMEQAAERHFERALEIARRQNAHLLELRAATCLARLWQSQGRETQARALLAAIHGRFQEGKGTADLRVAATLLEQLVAS